MGGGGLLSSLKRLLATSIGIAKTRAELLSVEFGEEIARLSRLFLLAVLALFFLGLSVVLFSVLIVVAFWDENRLLALGMLGTLFATSGAFAGFLFLAKAKQKPALFSQSLSELSKDLKELE